MANPSSSHHDSRHRSSSHHHHRTISSTTLLLVLSLILAVLAVMLSLPSNHSWSTSHLTHTHTGTHNTHGTPGQNPGTNIPEPPHNGFWGYLTPKRSQALIQRETAVALREAEVARREAELLANAPGGINLPSCPVSVVETTVVSPPPPVETVYKEIIREQETISPPPSPYAGRIEDIIAREQKVSEREKDVGRREEVVGRRESDASRRESWIMEQLMTYGDEAVETEEYVYDHPAPRRKHKELPIISFEDEPPVVHTTIIEQSVTVTETVRIPSATGTRVAARPTPEVFVTSVSGGKKAYPTTEVTVQGTPVAKDEIIEEDIVEEEVDEPQRRTRARTLTRRAPQATRRAPARWEL